MQAPGTADQESGRGPHGLISALCFEARPWRRAARALRKHGEASQGDCGNRHPAFQQFMTGNAGNDQIAAASCRNRQQRRTFQAEAVHGAVRARVWAADGR